MVRKHYQQQYRFDNSPIANVTLNLECRDEIVPILFGLQHLYNDTKLRRKAVQLIAADLNEKSRRDVGRPGMDDWHVAVLAAVRLGCNFDYDKLQDKVENHRALRGIMGIGEWEDTDGFTFRRIRDTLCQIKPITLSKINDLVVQAGHTIQPDAATSIRADSFVIETNDKLFSMFETHTQLYRRGKAGKPNQYGRLVMVFEDGAGFISHYHLMDREANDKDVVVAQTKIAQKKHAGQIETASFDRGFHSDENEVALSKIVDDVCVLPRHPGQYAERLKQGSIQFHQTRLRHSGVESAIGVLQRGNGLKRCRDRSELGFERYFGLAILGRNIHTLGKLLLATHHSQAASAQSKRDAA